MLNQIDLTKFKSFITVKEKFFSCLPKDLNSNNCWLWTNGTKHNKQYGKIRWGDKRYGAHVISYMIHKGPIPHDKIVLHTCENKNCVNPDHLYLGTYRDNAIDNIKCGEHPKAKLNEEAVKVIKWMLKYQNAPGLIKKLAVLHNVDLCVISNIKAGRRWSCVTI